MFLIFVFAPEKRRGLQSALAGGHVDLQLSVACFVQASGWLSGFVSCGGVGAQVSENGSCLFVIPFVIGSSYVRHTSGAIWALLGFFGLILYLKVGPEIHDPVERVRGVWQRAAPECLCDPSCVPRPISKLTPSCSTWWCGCGDRGVDGGGDRDWMRSVGLPVTT